MYIKQLSFFLENRLGRMLEVSRALSEEGINILSLCVADTSDYGLLRAVVSNPERALEILKGKGFSALMTEVLAVKLERKVGELERLLEILNTGAVNVEYLYIVNTPAASLVLKVSEPERAAAAMKAAGVELAGEEIYRLDSVG